MTPGLLIRIVGSLVVLGGAGRLTAGGARPADACYVWADERCVDGSCELIGDAACHPRCDAGSPCTAAGDVCATVPLYAGAAACGGHTETICVAKDTKLPTACQ